MLYQETIQLKLQFRVAKDITRFTEQYGVCTEERHESMTRGLGIMFAFPSF